MRQRPFIILIFPVLVLLSIVLEHVRVINSFYLTIGACAVSVLIGLIAGVFLLLLKRGHSSNWLQLIFILGVFGFIFIYIDVLLYSDRRFLIFFGFENGARPLWALISLVAIATIITTALVFLLWRHEKQTINFFVVLFAVALASSTFITIQAKLAKSSPSVVASGPNSQSDKLTIYIILDGMIGSAGLRTGIPENAALADEIDTFFKKYDFNHFNRAFSRLYYSKRSIPALLNGLVKDIPPVNETVVSQNNVHRLVKNALFDSLHEHRQSIRVYQTSYLRFCEHRSVLKCNTLSTSDPFSIHLTAGLPPNITFLSPIFKFEQSLKLSFVTRYVVQGLFKPLHFVSRRLWPLQYSFATRSPTYTDLTFNSWFDIFTNDITSSSGGIYFAHFMMPHFPFRVDSTCKPVMERFKLASFDRFVELGGLTPDSAKLKRRELYALYRDQVRCVYRKLSALFDYLKEQGRYQNSRIILLGDHGSRISNAYSKEFVSTQDLIDNYSTLFSIKNRDGTANIDQRMISVQQLLLALGTAPPKNSLNNVIKTIIIPSAKGDEWSYVPMPPF